MQANQSVEQPIIDIAELARASAYPARVEAEFAKWRDDPDKYIEQNYNKLAAYDFPVYAAANIKITNKNGRSVGFALNRIQKKLWEWFLQDLAAGVPVRWFVIKSRQVGVSTWTLSLFYWLTSLRPNRNALIVTQDEASVTNFNSRFRSIHAECNPLLRSQTILDRRDAVHFGNKTTSRQAGAGVGLDSRAIFATAARGELGRSYNFHYVFLSEFCIWPELGIDVNSQMVALNQCVADLPGTIIILESTAKGENEATKMWHDKDNGYRKIFIPWVAHDEYRRPPKRPLGDLCDSDEASGYDTRYGNEKAEARLIRDALPVWYADEIAIGGEEWIEEEVQARLNWRRYCIDKKCNGDVQAFRREYPTIPSHAFSGKAKNCFDHHSLELMRKHVEEEGIRPERFNYVHDPESTDPNDKFTPNTYGSLHVYKQPEMGRVYVLAGDPGMGIPNSGDPSALVVLDVTDVLEEVASYNEIVTPDKFAEMAYYLGKIYNTALLGIEDNERGGFAANLILAKTLCYERLLYRFDAYDKKAASKPGFHTTDTNKSVNVAKLQQLIRDHEILFRTPALNDQLQHFIQLPDGTMGGSPGWNDDLVSAALIAVHLSAKVHIYPQRQEPPPGSIGWQMKKGTLRRGGRRYA